MCDLNQLTTTLTAPTNEADVPAWLAQQVTPDRPFLLAHTDDGVIWGRWTGQRLYLASEAAPDLVPVLSGLTLQQAVAFGRQNEVRLFRDELGHWQARQIVDAQPPDIVIEQQILWGDEVIEDVSNAEFTHVREARQQGLDQVLPIPVTRDDLDAGRRAMLEVHHFIEYDGETGEARIGLSRLVNVFVSEEAL